MSVVKNIFCRSTGQRLRLLLHMDSARIFLYFIKYFFQMKADWQLAHLHWTTSFADALCPLPSVFEIVFFGTHVYTPLWSLLGISLVNVFSAPTVGESSWFPSPLSKYQVHCISFGFAIASQLKLTTCWSPSVTVRSCGLTVILGASVNKKTR